MEQLHDAVSVNFDSFTNCWVLDTCSWILAGKKHLDVCSEKSAQSVGRPRIFCAWSTLQTGHLWGQTVTWRSATVNESNVPRIGEPKVPALMIHSLVLYQVIYLLEELSDGVRLLLHS